MKQRRAADPERARRLKVKRGTLAALAALGGRAPAGPPPELAAHGLVITTGGVVVLDSEVVGQLGPAHRGSGAPVRLYLSAAAQPKRQRLVAPSWLALVRMMPCSAPGCRRGRPLYDQLQLGISQSEANHHPRRGAGGGGSDLEVHPVCTDCHRRITEYRHFLDGTRATAELLDRLVADTLLVAMRAVSDGRVQSGIVLAAAVEILLSQGA